MWEGKQALPVLVRRRRRRTIQVPTTAIMTSSAAPVVAPMMVGVIWDTRDGEVVDVCADPGAVELGVETVGVEDFEVADWCKLESLALVVVSNEPELTRK